MKDVEGFVRTRLLQRSESLVKNQWITSLRRRTRWWLRYQSFRSRRFCQWYPIIFSDTNLHDNFVLLTYYMIRISRQIEKDNEIRVSCFWGRDGDLYAKNWLDNWSVHLKSTRRERSFVTKTKVLPSFSYEWVVIHEVRSTRERSASRSNHW